jgi:hypothetical protein
MYPRWPANRYCVPLTNLRGLSKEELKIFQRFESKGPVLAASRELEVASLCHYIQVPTVVVFTLRDEKTDDVLSELITRSGGDFSAENIEKLRPEAEKMVLDYCLKEKEKIVGQDKTTGPGLRFAVLGGLAAQYP